MPPINPYDPLSYPVGAGSAEPLTFDEPKSVGELLRRLHQWLTVPRWRQKGWITGAKNVETPECACLLGALAICRLGGKNPQQVNKEATFWWLLRTDPLCQEAVALLHKEWSKTETPLPKLSSSLPLELDDLVRWQDHSKRAYSEVYGLIDRTIEDYFYEGDDGLRLKPGNYGDR